MKLPTPVVATVAASWFCQYAAPAASGTQLVDERSDVGWGSVLRIGELRMGTLRFDLHGEAGGNRGEGARASGAGAEPVVPVGMAPWIAGAAQIAEVERGDLQVGLVDGLRRGAA